MVGQVGKDLKRSIIQPKLLLVYAQSAVNLEGFKKPTQFLSSISLTQFSTFFFLNNDFILTFFFFFFEFIKLRPSGATHAWIGEEPEHQGRQLPTCGVGTREEFLDRSGNSTSHGDEKAQQRPQLHEGNV